MVVNESTEFMIREESDEGLMENIWKDHISSGTLQLKFKITSRNS